MKPLNIFLLENEVLTIQTLKAYLEDKGYQVINVAKTQKDALTFFNHHTADIVIADIDLGLNQPDGITVVQQIKTKNPEIPIIYFTGMEEEVIFQRAKSTRPDAFLNKPVNPINLTRTIDLAIDNYHKRRTHSVRKNAYLDAIFVFSDNAYRKVLVGDIKYVKSDGSYCRIQLDNKEILQSYNLANFVERNPDPRLMRVSRFYVVNLDRVDSIQNNCLEINGELIPIGKSYEELVFQQIPLINATK